MDEGNVRPHAGQQGDGTVHRVGLTRHCIASGVVQLPFALRDTLPEGELLALDVERDEAVVLEVVPPRALSGLADFFEAHDLQVNDRLEIRIRGRDLGEVRLVAVRSARRPTRSEDRRLGADDRAAEPSSEPSSPSADSPSGSAVRDDVPSSVSRPGPSPLPDTSVQDALDHGDWSSARASSDGPDVVETIGSVTVRRLGAGRFAAPAPTTLARRAEDLEAEAPSTRDARLGVSGRTDAVADTSADAAAEESPGEPLDAPVETRTEPTEPAEPTEPTDRPTGRAGRAGRRGAR
ncbi:MAG: hypothetical protein U5J97_00645 [Trueperaceae bacterium]|nr:hypothetical protein [Trueperaceae bacterium]